MRECEEIFISHFVPFGYSLNFLTFIYVITFICFLQHYQERYLLVRCIFSILKNVVLKSQICAQDPHRLKADIKVT